MISDSPYKVNDLIFPPLVGGAVGLAAAFLMLAVVRLMQPFSGLSPEMIFSQWGTFVLPQRFEQIAPQTIFLIGLGIHFLLRFFIGILYALSQQRIPPVGLLIVGVFFGVFNWIIGSVVFGIGHGEEWRGASRSWTWLIANLVFGLTLAAAAIVTEKLRPSAEIVVPID